MKRHTVKAHARGTDRKAVAARKAAIDAAQRPQWDDFRARHPERVTCAELNPEED